MPDSEFLIYSVFSELMETHMKYGFGQKFENIGELSTKCMKVIESQDSVLHFHISRSLDTISLVVMLLPTFILWLHFECKSVQDQLSLWTFFMTFPKSNIALCCMIAAMLLSLKEPILKIDPSMPLLTFFNGRSDWNWKDLKQATILLYSEVSE